jgi:hypothetical protein
MRRFPKGRASHNQQNFHRMHPVRFQHSPSLSCSHTHRCLCRSGCLRSDSADIDNTGLPRTDRGRRRCACRGSTARWKCSRPSTSSSHSGNGTARPGTFSCRRKACHQAAFSCMSPSSVCGRRGSASSPRRHRARPIRGRRPPRARQGGAPRCGVKEERSASGADRRSVEHPCVTIPGTRGSIGLLCQRHHTPPVHSDASAKEQDKVGEDPPLHPTTTVEGRNCRASWPRPTCPGSTSRLHRFSHSTRSDRSWVHRVPAGKYTDPRFTS